MGQTSATTWFNPEQCPDDIDKVFCVSLPWSDSMMSTFSQLTAEVARAAEEREPAIVARMIERIKSLSREEQRLLLQTAMLAHREIGLPGQEWEPHRTLIGVILHAVGMRTLEDADQRAVRMAIQEDHDQRIGVVGFEEIEPEL